MSALDDAVQQYRSGKQKDARAELAVLRAENLQLSAGDYLLREIGAALNCAPDATILQNIEQLRASEQYWQQTAETERANAAAQRERAERLRADYERAFDAVTELDRQIVAQARQLEQAREAIQPFATIGDVFSKLDHNDDSVWTKLPDNQMIAVGWSHLTVTINDLRRASAWLTANAPAPQAQPAQMTADERM